MNISEPNLEEFDFDLDQRPLHLALAGFALAFTRIEASLFDLLRIMSGVKDDKVAEILFADLRSTDVAKRIRKLNTLLSDDLDAEKTRLAEILNKFTDIAEMRNHLIHNSTAMDVSGERFYLMKTGSGTPPRLEILFFATYSLDDLKAATGDLQTIGWDVNVIMRAHPNWDAPKFGVRPDLRLSQSPWQYTHARRGSKGQ